MNAATAPARPFVDPATAPTEAALAATLGPAYDRYARLIADADAFRRDWAYSKSSGWMLKVHRAGKALFYVIPLAGSFRVSMAIREAERSALLTDPDLAEIRDRLSSARRVPEGFALQFDVLSETDLPALDALLTKLIAARA